MARLGHEVIFDVKCCFLEPLPVVLGAILTVFETNKAGWAGLGL
jgi:hypothetical protein